MNKKHTIHDHLIRNIITLIAFILLFVYSGHSIDADWGDAFDNRNQASVFISGLLQPEWSYLSKLVGPMLDTIAMSLLGTFMGVLLSIPTAFLGTYVVTRNQIVTSIFRIFFSLVRTIPNLLLAALFVAIVGIGELTGVLTITVFTFGMVSQLIYGRIETIDLGPIEADESIGATRFQIAVNAIWPQVKSEVTSYALYAFEVNIRASAVLGYVGAGGIGVMLNTAMAFNQMGRVSLIILIIFVLVIITDILSQYIRKELL